jgi:hypothetical protein
MKAFITLLAYAVVSGLVGLIVCGLLFYRQKYRAGCIAVLVFFGGPVLGYVYLEVDAHLQARQFEEDVAYVKELCAKYGGDKIYRTVDNVEGVFQMRARNPDPDAQWRDQFGMIDPWGRAIGDSPYVAVRLFETPEHGGYLYFEQQSSYQKEGPPYRRTLITWTGKRIVESQPYYPQKDWMQYGRETITVAKLRSRYGYITEDISTPEMRKRWIGGGRVKVFDLQTNEMMAETTGFFKARGLSVSDHWASTNTLCPMGGGLNGFLAKVLHPKPWINPDSQSVKSLLQE